MFSPKILGSEVEMLGDRLGSPKLRMKFVKPRENSNFMKKW